MTSKATNAAGLTAREVDILCAICQSFKSKPETDMQKFATLAGFTTKASAKTTMYKVLKKVMGKDSASPEASKKSGGRKRKAAASESAEEDDVESTTSKENKKKKKKGSDLEGNNSAGDSKSDEGEAAVKEEVLEDNTGSLA